jgi:hypothetical protein
MGQQDLSAFATFGVLTSSHPMIYNAFLAISISRWTSFFKASISLKTLKAGNAASLCASDQSNATSSDNPDAIIFFATSYCSFSFLSA